MYRLDPDSIFNDVLKLINKSKVKEFRAIR